MDRTNVGLVHPGEMGAAIGGALARQGLSVLWASAGRGPATAERAAAAGLTDAGTVAQVAARAGVILSICPPHAAREVAAEVAGAGFGGLFVDANAISPRTTREVAAIIGGGGGGFVDGGIIGLPPGQESGRDSGPDRIRGPRLYLSGGRAPEVADLFAGTVVAARIMAGGVGAASAVKMAYAAWTKGSAALLLAARALAHAEHVEDSLLAEWELSQPGLAARSGRAAQSATAKGWRWDAEMAEIAASMAADGLPDGFHLAAAEIFRRSPRAAGGNGAGGNGAGSPDAALAQVLGALAGQQSGSRSDR